MKTIWKFELKPGVGFDEIPIPKGSKFDLPFKVLSICVRNKIPYLYIFLDMGVENNPIQTSGALLIVQTFATGETIPQNFKEADWIGTYFIEEYSEVYHVFVVTIKN